jgi:hypothetical protein
MLVALLPHVVLFYHSMIDSCIRVSMVPRTTLWSGGLTIVTVSFLATEVFPDADVVYRYVTLLYLSTACLRAA